MQSKEITGQMIFKVVNGHNSLPLIVHEIKLTFPLGF